MSFSRADLDRLSAIMAEAAETEIMPRFRSLEDGGIREKTGALDLVTDADEQGEWMIRDLCAKAFPHAALRGRGIGGARQGAADQDRRRRPRASSSIPLTAPRTSPGACRCSA